MGPLPPVGLTRFWGDAFSHMPCTPRGIFPLNLPTDAGVFPGFISTYTSRFGMKSGQMPCEHLLHCCISHQPSSTSKQHGLSSQGFACGHESDGPHYKIIKRREWKYQAPNYQTPKLRAFCLFKNYAREVRNKLRTSTVSCVLLLYFK